MKTRLKQYKSIQTKQITDGINKEIDLCKGKLRKLNHIEQDLLQMIEKIFRKTLQDLEEPLPAQQRISLQQRLTVPFKQFEDK